MPTDGQIITIVGAGLAGLSAAYALEKLGYSPIIFEASDRIGGRAKTDHIDGFVLDHGFHVILSSFNEVFSVVSKQDLELGFFPSGAMIQHNGEWISVLNPIRDPEKMVFRKEHFFFDFLKLSKLYLAQKMQSDQRMMPDPQPPSIWDLLNKAGLSVEFIEEAVRPFLAGIFFDPNMHSSSYAFKRIFTYFIEGKPGLPKKGIEALPRSLAKKLTTSRIKLQTKVEKIEKGKLHLSTGEIFSTDWILLATDLHATSSFYPLLSERQVKAATCLYFALDEGLIEPAPFLYLDGTPNQPINNFCFNNLVQLSYAPEGKLLLSVVVVHAAWQKNPDLQDAVVNQLCTYFNVSAKKWQHLKTYAIDHALPDQSRPPFFHGKYCFDREKRIYLCGETVDPPSFNDAITSGKKAAEILHRDISTI
jgi:protoporphyrinogen oxidase